MKIETYFDLMDLVQKQGKIINDQADKIAKLINENAEKENIINEWMEG